MNWSVGREIERIISLFLQREKGWVGEEGKEKKAMVKLCDGVIVLDLLEWKVW